MQNLNEQIASLADRVDSMARQLSRLVDKVENPELQKYSIDEACHRLRKSRSSFYRLKDQGLLEVFKEGGRLYTTEAAILRCERKLRQDRQSSSRVSVR